MYIVDFVEYGPFATRVLYYQRDSWYWMVSLDHKYETTLSRISIINELAAPLYKQWQFYCVVDISNLVIDKQALYALSLI